MGKMGRKKGFAYTLSGQRTRTMFGPTRHEKYGEIVTFKDGSREAAAELKREFDAAKTRTKKVRILRATQLAANRARASLKRKKRPLSSRVRARYLRVAETYEEASDYMQRRLD